MADDGGAVVLLSGGLDSSTVLGVAVRDQAHASSLVALSFAYGQRHQRELSAAQKVAAFYGVSHMTLPVPMTAIGGSVLTDMQRRDLPHDRPLSTMAESVPVTYVPGRNLIFLALAAAVAEARGWSTIYFGATQVDFSGYPDCRAAFISAVKVVLNVGTRIGTEDKRPWSIIAPLLMLGKKQIVQLACAIGVPLEHTWSCYAGGDVPCGVCDSCRLRAAGFADAGYADPALGGRA